MANNKDIKSGLNTAEPGFFRELWNQLRLVFELLRDRDVPIYLKALPFLGLAYVIFPIDFIPDVVPGLGQLDDLTLIIVGLKMFIELAPSNIVAKHLAQLRGQSASSQVIEGEASDVVKEKKSLSEPVIIEVEDSETKNS